MKKKLILFFFLISLISFSQKKVIKKIETQSKEIEVLTIGLDDFVLENSTSGFVEIILFAENSNEQHILVNSENNVFQIEFKIAEIQPEETVFRKFITKRLHRASAIVKIPEGIKTTIFGDNINIESKDFEENLSIFIENGIVKLNQIKENTQVKLYSGNVSGILKNSNVDLNSKFGKIKIDEVFYEKKYQNKAKINQQKLDIKTIKANIFLTTK
jgi:hypothetical protein